jgi:hypothetical protein
MVRSEPSCVQSFNEDCESVVFGFAVHSSSTERITRNAAVAASVRGS